MILSNIGVGVLAQIPKLNRYDRADCDGPAYVPAAVRVQLASGNILDFCMHHYKQHELALMAAGARVIQGVIDGGK